MPNHNFFVEKVDSRFFTYCCQIGVAGLVSTNRFLVYDMDFVSLSCFKILYRYIMDKRLASEPSVVAILLDLFQHHHDLINKLALQLAKQQLCS